MEDPKPLVNPVAATVQSISPPQGQDVASVPVPVAPAPETSPQSSNTATQSENTPPIQVPIKPKVLPAIQPQQEKKKQIRSGSTIIFNNSSLIIVRCWNSGNSKLSLVSCTSGSASARSRVKLLKCAH